MERLRKKLPNSGPVTVRVNTPEAMNEAIDKHGTLITAFVASRMAKVSEQRIYSLLDQGKFTIIVAYGVAHVPHLEFERWRKSARKCGRPRNPERENRVQPGSGSKKATQLEFETKEASVKSLRKS